MSSKELKEHPWFTVLGPEPLGNKYLGKRLYDLSRNKSQPVKPFIMDAKTVVGVGNIYASESLYRAGIDPTRPAGNVSKTEYETLAKDIQTTLKEAIKAGGTTFRDFRNVDGNPGYFRISLGVYDREGEPCKNCLKPIRHLRQTGRSTYFCAFCQS